MSWRIGTPDRFGARIERAPPLTCWSAREAKDMKTPVAHAEPKVGDEVRYHGSVIIAHGDGEIVKVHENGRVDIRVTELSHAFEQRGHRWVEVPFRLVERVRPQSWKPLAEEVDR